MADDLTPNFELPPSKVQEFLDLLRENNLEEEFLRDAPSFQAYPEAPAGDPSAGRLNADAFGAAKTVTARDLAASVERFARQGSFLSNDTLLVDSSLVDYAAAFVDRKGLADRSELARSLASDGCKRRQLRRDCPPRR